MTNLNIIGAVRCCEDVSPGQDGATTPEHLPTRLEEVELDHPGVVVSVSRHSTDNVVTRGITHCNATITPLEAANSRYEEVNERRYLVGCSGGINIILLNMLARLY